MKTQKVRTSKCRQGGKGSLRWVTSAQSMWCGLNRLLSEVERRGSPKKKRRKKEKKEKQLFRADDSAKHWSILHRQVTPQLEGFHCYSAVVTARRQANCTQLGVSLEELLSRLELQQMASDVGAREIWTRGTCKMERSPSGGGHASRGHATIAITDHSWWAREPVGSKKRPLAIGLRRTGLRNTD